MTALTRRSLLLGATALAGTAAMPPVALLAEAAPAAAPEIGARLPAWLVGPADDFGWDVIRAATEEDALAGWLDHMGIMCECGTAMPGGDPVGPDECERCSYWLDAKRAEEFDAIDHPTPGDWLRAGHGSTCSRCDEETFCEWNGHAIGDEAVCECCMTLEDWRIADPARAAEMEAEDLA